MRILSLFDKYLVILVVIQGLIMITIDYATFKEYKMKEVAKKSRVIGISAIVIVVTLSILRLILS
ncbi:CLC_0170 family protein [Oceanirhabdus sp. W0125-5]|uniref:CLC_0170 family protein n=1 Tax=Oceanirhabdus sp. W0125-5 TaxID=2999116 RepID=UPI0022F2FAA0|nr:CLC_0170 family protein [Oceanirhabdus sp. W0125-5]WBW98461.1 hypothetical protein OW730_06750 [Oceanirhabdus sp. W0125-5]